MNGRTFSQNPGKQEKSHHHVEQYFTVESPFIYLSVKKGGKPADL